jgi:hypothetical protein
MRLIVCRYASETYTRDDHNVPENFAHKSAPFADALSVLDWSRPITLQLGKARFAVWPSHSMPKKMKTEYVEGSKALENFEQLAKTVLQSPRPSILNNKKNKISSRKPKNSDKD